jgi:hypothetical protein
MFLTRSPFFGASLIPSKLPWFCPKIGLFQHAPNNEIVTHPDSLTNSCLFHYMCQCFIHLCRLLALTLSLVSPFPHGVYHLRDYLGFRYFPPSKLICSNFYFVASISTTNFLAFSYGGSNWAFLSIFSSCTTFSSSCRLCIFAVVLIFLGSDNVFCLCFNYSISTWTLSCFSCNSCNLPSSCNCFHS